MPTPKDEATQREVSTGIAAELVAAGLGDPSEIGSGGFGTVYRCYEHALERHVAVKLLTTDVLGEDRDRFVREQRALGRLSGHPHIVQVFHVDITVTGRPYIVMPYYPRGSLDRLLREGGRLRWHEVLPVAVKLAGALAAAHAAGIVHRDVKPGNILLTDYGEPQLSDFGIAQFGEVATSSSLVHGTLAYTAPEVLRGAPPTAAADVYGLGATLFCLLTGRPPAARNSGEPLEVQLARLAADRLPGLRDQGVPDAVRIAIETATAIRPEDRPSSMTEFGELLREAQRSTGQPVDVMALPLRGESERGVVGPAALLSNFAGSITVAPPSAATKFRPPAAGRTLIDRPRLLHILRDGELRRLTLIHGPAGFGKTTLAAQWARELEADGVPVAWLTTDPDDDNVLWFLAHLIQAIRRVRPELARELGGLLEERSSDAARTVLSTLIDEIHDSARTMVLVVDDWQQVRSENTIAAMGYLLEHGCHHMPVVVVGRGRSGLPVSKLLVHDELVEIDSTALRFDALEASVFLIGMNGLPLNDRDVDKVQESTEGWAAGLQLAQLSLAGRDDPGEFIDNLTGRHHVIGEYLAENVLSMLEPEVLDFLLATSITTTICADLAAALTGGAECQRMLEQIADRNLFLQRMDDIDEWFRYHRLFADALQRKLSHQDPDRIMPLHARASAWFYDHDMLVEAVDHALAADDPDRAVELVEAQAWGLVQSLRMATFRGLMAKLPRPLTESRRRLQLCVGWANIGLGRTEQIHRALDNALASIENITGPEAITVRVEAELVRGLNYFITDRYESLPDLFTEHIDDLGDPYKATSAADLAAIDALNRFDLPAVHRWHRTALRYSTAIGPHVLQFSHCMAGLAEWEQLDTAAVEHHFTVTQGVPRDAEQGTRLSIEVDALLGQLRYFQDRLAEADELLRAGTIVEREAAGADFLLAIYPIGARVAALRGDLPRAERLLSTGERFAQERSLPRLAAGITNERIRAGLPIADDIREHLRMLPPYSKQDNRISAHTAELEQNSAIRLLLADRSPTAIAAACDRAEHLLRVIETQSRPTAQLQASLLYACCLWAADRHDEAKTIARPALSLCTERGVPRLATDAGPPDIMSALTAAVR